MKVLSLNDIDLIILNALFLAFILGYFVAIYLTTCQMTGREGKLTSVESVLVVTKKCLYIFNPIYLI